MDHAEQLHLDLSNKLDQTLSGLSNISTRAMRVKLTQSKPGMTKRSVRGETILATELGDTSTSAYTTLFKDPGNPMRQLLNLHGEAYREHIRLTWADQPRGDRLLPVALFEEYRDVQRQIKGRIDAFAAQHMPNYDAHVQTDIDRRMARRTQEQRNNLPPITPCDYPSADEFESSLSTQFKFSTLPDARHPLFDSSSAELQAVKEQLASEIASEQQEMAQRIRDEAQERIKDPLRKLIEKLVVPAGTPGSVFRDSAVGNVVEAAALVKQMCMGDPDIAAMCDAVSQVTGVFAKNVDVLRESPVVRESVAAKLKEVENKMAFMFAGQ